MNFYNSIEINTLIENVKKANYHNNQVEYTLFFQLKLDDIEENQNTFQLLQYCSFLNPDFIPVNLLIELLKLENQEMIQEYINKLSKLSLITEINENNQNGVQIHRLVQEELRLYAERDSEIDDAIVKNMTIYNNLVETLNRKFENPNEQYYLQTLSLYEIVDKFSTTLRLKRDNYYSSDEAVLYEKLFNYEYNRKDYKKCFEKGKKLFEIKNNLTTPPNDLELIKTVKKVGELGLKNKDNQTALIYKLKEFDLRNGCNESRDERQLADLLDEIGSIHYNLNNYRDALEFKIKSWDMSQKLGIADNLELASSLNGISQIYEKLNDFANAFKFKNESINMYKRLESDSIELADLINHKSKICEQLGDYDVAIESKEEALKIYKRVTNNSDEHKTIILLMEISNCYEKLENKENSFKYFKQSEDMKERLYGNTFKRNIPLPNTDYAAITNQNISNNLFQDNRNGSNKNIVNNNNNFIQKMNLVLIFFIAINYVYSFFKQS